MGQLHNLTGNQVQPQDGDGGDVDRDDRDDDDDDYDDRQPGPTMLFNMMMIEIVH